MCLLSPGYQGKWDYLANGTIWLPMKVPHLVNLLCKDIMFHPYFWHSILKIPGIHLVYLNHFVLFLFFSFKLYHVCSVECMRKSEDNLQVLALTFCLVGFRNWIQHIRFHKHLYPLSYFAGPPFLPWSPSWLQIWAPPTSASIVLDYRLCQYI